MLDSPCQPYMFEDCVHARWIAFLLRLHTQLMQEWDSICVTKGRDVKSRIVRANGVLCHLVLSDIYRSLDANLIPCNDTLLYGNHYPIVSSGYSALTPDHRWANQVGWVCIQDANTSEVKIFQSAASDDRHGDPGCSESLTHKPTKDIFKYLRSRNLLVQPVVNRPGAVIWDDQLERYGLVKSTPLVRPCIISSLLHLCINSCLLHLCINSCLLRPWINF
jgi:hypothetical protein